MIVLMKLKQLKKKHDKLCKLREFCIINCTTSPKVRDFHNVVSDVTEASGNRISTGMNALAFQPPQAMFDESQSVGRRDQYKHNFFTNEAFAEELYTIIARQVSKPDENIYICIDDEAYDNLANEYIERFEEILGFSVSGLIYTWNDAIGMGDYIKKYCEKQISKFDDRDEEDRFLDDLDLYDRQKDSKRWKTSSLDDDEHDAYYDWLDVRSELENAEDSKAVRKIFLKSAKPSKKMMKRCGNALAKFDKNSKSID